MRVLLLALLPALLIPSVAEARATDSVIRNARAEDVPWDDGSALRISWQGQLPPGHRVRVVREAADAKPETVAELSAQSGLFVDTRLSPEHGYTYRLSVFDGAGVLVATTSTGGPVSPAANWIDRARLGEAILVGFIFAVVLWGMYRRPTTYVRPIGGLQAMEEAIGRAVEMGRPVLFSAGWGAQLDKPTTMAAMNIFGWVARKAAALDAQLLYPAHDAVIMSAAQESAREGAQVEGRPEWYNPDHITYVTGSQFGYAAALDGVMERQRPATNLWLGTFAAESLILAETGNQVGAVQIAGTDSTIQLAFFLVTCDYTLIGEEVFAASAYLTRDATVLGGLWAQDMLKIVVGAAVAVGLVGTLLGWTAIGDWLRAI